MKHISLFVTALISTAAFADASKTIKAGETASLTSCGGHVTTRLNSDEQLVLNFSSVDNCSNFDITKADGKNIGDYKAKKLGGGDRNRSGSFTIPKSLMGDKSVTVIVKSNSGKTSDTIKVIIEADHYAAQRIKLGQSAILRVCGGSLDTDNGPRNNQMNLVFRNMRDCSKFDILKATGEGFVDYPTKDVPGKNGNFSGSFTVPQKFYNNNSNAITVVVKSNSGKHEERVTISYVGSGW